MRKIPLTLLSLSMLCVPTIGHAQMASPMAPKEVPQFLPKAGWTVKPAVTGDMRNLNGLKLPCLMMVEYDNGYVMRLSGGNGQLMAMAIDFRQDVFVQGRKYQANISIDGASVGQVQATSFSKNALIINTRNIANIYDKIATGQQMSLDVEGNKFQFRLGNVSEAAGRLEACYNGDTAISTAGMSQPLGVDNIVPNGNIETASLGNQSTATIKWNDTKQAMLNPPTAVEMPASQPRRSKPSEIWRARKGDSMKATLTRWADKAGVAIDWQADMQGEVVQDMALTNSFESAVQTLIAQNSAATGIQADLKGVVQPSNQNTKILSPTVSRMPTPLVPVSSPMTSTYTTPRMSETPIAPQRMTKSNVNWKVNQGANLRVALEEWSEREGVQLLWQANQNFSVRQDIANDGSYEEALRSILIQFTNDSVRPIAQLNSDPTTGRRILIVQSSRVL